MGEFFKLVAELGFPIAAALAGGYFVFFTLKLVYTYVAMYFLGCLKFLPDDLSDKLVIG